MAFAGFVHFVDLVIIKLFLGAEIGRQKSPFLNYYFFLESDTFKKKKRPMNQLLKLSPSLENCNRKKTVAQNPIQSGFWSEADFSKENDHQ